MFDLIQYEYSSPDTILQRRIYRIGDYTGSFFIMLLRNFTVKHFSKLNVLLSDTSPTHISVKLFPGNNCLSLYKHFPRKQELENGDSYTRAMILLDELIESLEFVCEYYQWDKTALLRAGELCKKLDLRYEFLYGPVKTSRNRKHRACTGVAMSPEETTVFVAFFDAKTNTLIKKVTLCPIEDQHYYSACSTMGKRGWLDNDRFYVAGTAGYKVHTVSLSEGTHFVEKHPENREKLLWASFYGRFRPRLLNHPEDL